MGSRSNKEQINWFTQTMELYATIKKKMLESLLAPLCHLNSIAKEFYF